MEPVFVSRERELGKLGGFLANALEGRGRVCFVTGEAGFGKTSLTLEFARRAAHVDLGVTPGRATERRQRASRGTIDDLGGYTTGNIAYNASAATVQTALQGLTSIGSGNIDVSKTQNTGTAQEWTLTFQGALAAANQSQVTINFYFI